MRPVIAALAALALALAAPAAAAPRPDQPWAGGPARAAALEALVADPALTDARLETLAASPDWRVRQQAALLLGWRRTPELFARFERQAPLPAVNGMLRFRGDEVADPRLAPLLLERLLRRPERAETLALIEVLPRTGGDWADAFVALAAAEPDPALRAILVASLRWAPTAAAQAGIRAGLRDGSGLVRGEAARAAGWRKDGAGLASDLARVLGDADPYTRAMAARSLGYLRAGAAFEPLLPLLGDPDAEVRLQALRALERLDAARLRARPEIPTLRADPDPRVARAAAALR